MVNSNAEETWRKIWKSTSVDKIAEWDELSDIVYYLLCSVVTSFRGKMILEGGSGTGRISLKLADEKGAKVLLIDASKDAIRYSSILARRKKISADFILASIFALPIREKYLDIVWNSGVLEHFSFMDQQLAITESIRCLRPSGLSIVIVPNRRAMIYNMLRILSMKIGSWSVGYEEPLSSGELKKIRPPPSKIYSCGFFQQLLLVFVPGLSTLMKYLTLILRITLRSKFYLLDKIVPGYLLMGVFVRKE